MNVSLRQMEYALALAGQRSFRRAAEACHVSQPALSVQIAALEQQLGARLFDRDRRHVLVTAAGERLIARMRVAVSAAEAVGEEASLLRDPLSGRLRLGVIPTIAPYVLPSFLPAARKRFPALRLLLVEDQTNRLLTRLAEGGLDLVLLAEVPELAGLAVARLYDDPFVVALPAEHPLAARKSLREDHLDDQEVLLLEEGHCLREQALPICRRAGAHEAGAGDFRATSLGTLVQMVASGVALTLLPAMAVKVETRAAGTLAVRELPRGGPARTIVLAWRRVSALGSAYEQLAAVLRASAPAGTRDLSSPRDPAGRGSSTPRRRAT